ncbi:AAA family ATPase [Candidatus Dojkabacteria bacterium]|nr:AAA family ATPase [Candidatus Dojkabacteria bacterium]
MNKDFRRKIDLDLPKNKSAFLLGPRKVGKSTYLKENFSEGVYIDLLDTKQFIEYKNSPWLLTERMESLVESGDEKLKFPVVIDEIQKVPLLLNEVHRMIEGMDVRFILCGSSARKLRREGANMLGGRAWMYEMFPLVFPEIQDFDLLGILNKGKIPVHYLSDYSKRDIEDYIASYLKEEILNEGIARNLRAFTKFLEIASYSNSEILNYSNVARDVEVDAKTVKGYYQILVDTLIGNYVFPFKENKSRDEVLDSPKFYLFDTGVAQFLRGVELLSEGGEAFGHAFEHFIYTEIVAHSSYSAKRYSVEYWRTRGGAEVDFVLGGGELAVEVKGSSHVNGHALRGMYEFKKQTGLDNVLVVTNEDRERIHNGVHLVPYKVFLERLWNDDLI